MSDIGNIQNRNLGNLLKIFGSKQATDALKEMAKVKDSTWTDIKDTVSGLSTLSTGGGTGAIINSFKDTVELTILDAVSPLTNEVNQLITDWMTANITPILNDIFNGLGELVSDNSTGGLIGGIAGAIAGLFLPGGVILVAIGAVVGAWIESIFGPGKPPTEEEQQMINDKLDELNTKFEDAIQKQQDLVDEALKAVNDKLQAAIDDRRAKQELTTEELAALLEERAAERLRRERDRRVNPTLRGNIVF